MLHELPLLLGQFVKNVAHTLQSHILLVEIEAQREVIVGGSQMHVDQAVEGRLHRSEIILMNLGTHGWLVIRRKLKKWWLVMVIVDSFWRLHMEKWLEGGQRLEHRSIPGSALSKHC